MTRGLQPFSCPAVCIVFGYHMATDGKIVNLAMIGCGGYAAHLIERPAARDLFGSDVEKICNGLEALWDNRSDEAKRVWLKTEEYKWK